MTTVKMYWMAWLFVAMIGSGLYLTDSFSTTVSMIFGFVVSVLAGAALLVVYPALLSERVARMPQR